MNSLTDLDKTDSESWAALEGREEQLPSPVPLPLPPLSCPPGAAHAGNIHWPLLMT